MSEAAHVGENSNAQGVRADRHSPRSSWFATAGDWLLSLKWIDATKRFTAIILSLGSTILIALILALIAQGVFANTISIQAITVPKALEERGFTAEVAAQRLRDAMTEVVTGANAKMKGTDIELQSDEPNIIVPAVNLSLDTIISALRTFFRSSARRNISGDITDSKSKLWLRLRLNGKIFYTSLIGVSPDHPEQLFDGVASKVFWQIHPYVVASGISHTDNAKALELVNMIVGEPSNPNEDVALSYNLKAIVLRNRLQYDEGIRAAKKAIELDPRQANPHNTLGAILRDLGTMNEIRAKLRKRLPKTARLLNSTKTLHCLTNIWLKVFGYSQNTTRRSPNSGKPPSSTQKRPGLTAHSVMCCSRWAKPTRLWNNSDLRLTSFVRSLTKIRKTHS